MAAATVALKDLFLMTDDDLRADCRRAPPPLKPLQGQKYDTHALVECALYGRALASAKPVTMNSEDHLFGPATNTYQLPAETPHNWV